MPAKTPMDRLQAEAKLKPETTMAVEVEMDGKTLHVLPVMKWKASGIRALRETDFDLWAQKCLAPESYKVWVQIDPDIEQCEQFFTAWQEASGESRPE